MRLFTYFRDGYIGKHYTRLYCTIMNVIDFRLWFCECKYYEPYGRVTSADCRRHD